jgi:hypothetical protein
VCCPWYENHTALLRVDGLGLRVLDDTTIIKEDWFAAIAPAMFEVGGGVLVSLRTLPPPESTSLRPLPASDVPFDFWFGAQSMRMRWWITFNLKLCVPLVFPAWRYIHEADFKAEGLQLNSNFHADREAI